MTQILCPQSFKQAAKAVKAHKKSKIIPAGTLSSIKKQIRANNCSQAIISCQKMRRLNIEPENLIATAEAGLCPCEINQSLAPLNLYWPLTGLPTRSLGAIMAEGLVGAESMSHGLMSDWILGSSFVIADGSIINSGGRTLKNVSGYHLKSLLWKTYGQLGISLKFVLKLKPRPQTAPLIELCFKDIRAAVKTARALITLQYQADSLQIVLDNKQVVMRVWFSGFEELVSFKQKRLYDLATESEIHALADGFSFWNSEKNKMDSSAATKIYGQRGGMLNFLLKLADGSWEDLIERAEIDLGSGQALINWHTGVEIPPLEDGLEYDKPNFTDPVFKKIKKAMDPENIFFNPWL